MLLHCKSLSYSCPFEQRQLINRIDLSLNQGEHVFIHSHDLPTLSALAVILSGLGQQHLNGTISGTVQWKNRASPEPGSVALLQGGPSEQLSGCCFSVRDELVFGAENIGLPAPEILRSMDSLVDTFELRELLDQDPFSLSGGEQQRLLLASVLMMKPELLILQEPFSQLSPGAIKRLAGWLRLQKNMTVVYLSSNAEIYSAWVNKRFSLEEGILTESTIEAEAGAFKKTSALKPNAKDSDSKPLLEVDKLSFHYPEQPALLEDLSFSIKKGEVVAICGENGSGKSTLLNLIQGHLQPNSGDIKFQGRSICNDQPWERAHDIGFVFQQPEQQIFSATIREELAYGPEKTGKRKEDIKALVKKVGGFLKLDKCLDKNPLDGDYQQRKVINLGSVITMEPSLLLLDEPSAGIGEEQREQLVEYILELQSSGCTFLIVSHDPVFIQACSQRRIYLSE
ncbi:ATP-binding cassette domain-containing protein [Endozoicomonas gorgoniicola]|uniref:ATP-binding cassette domain-containing protein n=1 Tax=Endozoicomonas gorgoniicola TaxID=1234144 RepID=A0ABT3MSF5_9GAMM|nr:ATP-binding cassette domain-containing protein [Endozoicomonas gorgoniicola]MCW7552303.1 ATP-binding cassette domain-containing protein [Endozoicomonas gorgoniicola]